MNNRLSAPLKEQVGKVYKLGFYRKRFEETGMIPADIKTFDDFRKIPFTTPFEFLTEIRKRPSKSSLYSDQVTRVNLSPSGRDFYPVYQTNADLIKMHEVCDRSLRDAGLAKGDICAVTFGYHLFIAGLFYQGQLESFGAKVIPLGPGESERAIRVINDYEVSVLISNPTFAMKLAALGVPDIRILFVGGEPFTSVPGYSEKVRAAFGKEITIIDSYSMALCMPIARSCRYETGLHIMDDFIYAEVINPETGENLPYGQKGELVLTHLYKEASPLLRYRTGDLTVMEKKPCACGRELTLPKGVFGRTDEMLKIKGIKFWPSQIGMILRKFSLFTGKYRVIVKTVNGVDFVELILEASETTRTEADELLEELKQETLVWINEVRVVDTLEAGPMVVDKREGRKF